MVAARGETATERGCVVRRSGGGAVRSVAASWGVVLREVNGGWVHPYFRGIRAYGAPEPCPRIQAA
jgi:hypothetical protein